MFDTLENLIQRTVTTLAQVPGSGVQLYSEDRIQELLQQVYTINSDKFWIPEQMKWQNATLAGAAGLPSTDWEDVSSYKDIRAIFFNTSQRPLPRLPSDLNPFTVGGTVAKFQEPLSRNDEPSSTSNRLFRIWPLASTGTVYIHARLRDTNLFRDPTNTIYFDDVAMINGAAFMYAADDGANPGSVAKFQKLYEDRITEIQDNLNRQPIILDPRSPMGTDQWTEWPPV